MSKIDVFVSFDIEHDGELYKLILAQSEIANSNFEVLSSSEPFPAPPNPARPNLTLRQKARIRAAQEQAGAQTPS